MIYAEFETRNFSFKAFGKGKEHAIELLRKCWKKHCKEYHIEDVSLNYFDEHIEDVNFIEVTIGNALRDWDIKV